MTPEKFNLPNPHIQANVYYLTPIEGGRSTAVKSGYRGQIHIQGSDWDASQEFINKTECNPGERVDVLIQFATAHKLLTLFQGLKFRIKEGETVVGLGVITKLLHTELIIENESKNLYSKIDQILWENWDPIGINNETEARDEYTGYVEQVYSLKIKNADQEAIANHLLKIEIERMGLPGDIENCRKVAHQILTV